MRMIGKRMKRLKTGLVKEGRKMGRRVKARKE